MPDDLSLPDRGGLFLELYAGSGTRVECFQLIICNIVCVLAREQPPAAAIWLCISSACTGDELGKRDAQSVAYSSAMLWHMATQPAQSDPPAADDSAAATAPSVKTAGRAPLLRISAPLLQHPARAIAATAAAASQELRSSRTACAAAGQPSTAGRLRWRGVRSALAAVPAVRCDDCGCDGAGAGRLRAAARSVGRVPKVRTTLQRAWCTWRHVHYCLLRFDCILWHDVEVKSSTSAPKQCACFWKQDARGPGHGRRRCGSRQHRVGAASGLRGR